MSTQTSAAHISSPEQEPSLDSSQIAYLEGLYREGLDIPGSTEVRETHFKEISELVGDLAL